MARLHLWPKFLEGHKPQGFLAALEGTSFRKVVSFLLEEFMRIHWFIKKTAEKKKQKKHDKHGGLGNLSFLVGIIFRSYVRFRRNNLLKKYDSPENSKV